MSIRASINKGLSDELKAAFPNTIPTPRPEVEESLINHPWWVAGLKLVDLYSLKSKFKPGSVEIRQFSSKRSCSNSLNLVVWGTNLSSLVGFGRLTRQESNMVELPPYQFSVIIGLLLSDGWLIIASKTNKNARLEFSQSLSRSSYVWYVFNALSHYCNRYPAFRTRKTGTYELQFFTRGLACFTKLHLLFYPHGTKIIPKNIYDLLTPVALAHVIMGDGYASRHGLVICTDSYAVQDVVRIMNVLVIRYRLECTLRFHTPTQPRIYIKECSMPLLRQIVKLYMCSSMLYKIKL